MSALRHRVARVSLAFRSNAVRQVRWYASTGGEKKGAADHDHYDDHHDDHHGHRHSHNVEENLGRPYFIAVATIPASVLVYHSAQPKEDGEPNAITRLWNKCAHWGEEWERKNTLRTAALEQAAHDKHLFLNSGKSTYIELTYPEVFHHGCPMNVPAGHNVNIDHVIAHYRKKHLEEEERKAKKLAAAAAPNNRH